MPDIPAGAKFRTMTSRQQGRLLSDDGRSRHEGLVRSVDDMTAFTSVVSDMDRWLERVFDQALDGTVDELEDQRTLSGRLKGGGDNRNQPAQVPLRYYTMYGLQPQVP